MSDHDNTPVAEPAAHPYELDDDAFDALEELLVSDAVPEDCMNLEMLDGYLAAVVCAPQVLPASVWMPPIWTAHADEASFAAGSRMQKVIGLVRRYYNELATTLGEPEGWEPFCYAGQADSDFEVGEEWVEGFAQGLELWPADWQDGLPEEVARSVQQRIEAMLAPWQSDAEEGGEAVGEVANAAVDENDRIRWLEGARDTLGTIMAEWRQLGLSRPQPLPEVAEPVRRSAPSVGRNDACPCGSGKKFKKCCGAHD